MDRTITMVDNKDDEQDHQFRGQYLEIDWTILQGTKIIRWIEPSVQRTAFGDRLDYLAIDKIIIMIVGIPHYYDNCGLSNAIS